MKVISRQVAGGCVVPCYDYDRSQPIKLNLELPGNENLEPSKSDQILRTNLEQIFENFLKNLFSEFELYLYLKNNEAKIYLCIIPLKTNENLSLKSGCKQLFLRKILLCNKLQKSSASPN